MKKSIIIKIPEPCHEGWENMTPTEKGKFCSSCQKEVVDFSKKRDEDLVKELAGKKGICGRFDVRQLDREVKLERKSSHSVAPWAASLLLPLTLMATNPSKPDKLANKEFTSLGIGSLSNNNLRYQVTTSGVVRDEHGKPLAGVEIIVKESGKSELSGLRGDYEIKSLDHETLIFKKDGMVTETIQLEAKSEVRDIELKSIVSTLISNISCGLIYGNIMLPKSSQEEEEILGDIEVVQEIDELLDKEQQSVVVKGTVSDIDGVLPAVNILIKGTNIGTQTDFDGYYEIAAKPNDVLEFSYVGFATKEVTVSNVSNTIDVQLDSSAVLEGEIVMIVGGMVSSSYLETDEGVDPRYIIKTDEERQEWREGIKKAHANEIEFKRLQQQKKKAARKNKRKKGS